MELIRVKSWQKTRLTGRVGQRASAYEDYSRREYLLTGVMTEVRASEMSDLDMGEAGDGSSDAPMDVAMQMGTTVTPIAADTAGATMIEPMERNEHGKRRRSCEAPPTTRQLRSRMEGADQQKARKRAHLQRTIAKMATMRNAQTAYQEAQWRGMKTWLDERDEKWDKYHRDDGPCAKGVTNMGTRVVAAKEGGRSKERKADTDGAGLKSSIHVEAMQTGRPEKPEERRQLQPGRQLKPKLRPKSELNPTPTPMPRTTSTLIAVTTSVLTPPRWWETVPP